MHLVEVGHGAVFLGDAGEFTDGGDVAAHRIDAFEGDDLGRVRRALRQLAVEIGGFNIPGLRVRRTETTVALGDGETFVISGLVSQQSASAVDKFPVLGDIPILGAFFKSSRFSRSDKELLMIITPHLVRPFARNAKLPALPGEELRQYDPGYLHMLMMETGTFRQPDDSGFSR